MIGFGYIRELVSDVTGRYYMDIRRRIDNQYVEIYSNIPCFQTLWTPNAGLDVASSVTQQTQPIEQNFRVRASETTDLRNGDRIVIKNVTPNNVMTGWTYGNVGNPVTYNDFLVANMRETHFGLDDEGSITPPPEYFPDLEPNTYATIYIRFTREDGSYIREPVVIRRDFGDVTVSALVFDGYTFTHAEMDGIGFFEPEFNFAAENTVYNVTFFYTEQTDARAIKLLINSHFRRNNGTTGNGWHLYNNMRIISTEVIGGDDVFELESLSFTHDVTFRLSSISVGSILVTYPQMEWKRVVQTLEGNRIVVEPHEPTATQRSAYVIAR